MNFRILGALEAVGGTAAVNLGPPKQKALLAVLLLHAGEIVSVDSLIEALWPVRPPRTAAHSIQIYVSELRKALAPLSSAEIIVTRQPGYQLQAPDEAIDARQFERTVEQGMRLLQAGERSAGSDLLRSALALWRGPALSDFVYEEFAQQYIRRLDDQHLDTIEQLAAAELAAGLLPEAISHVEAGLREDALRERSREILMLALYRSGRHAEALRTYQRLRHLLADELGLDPSPALQRLQQRILLHDPTLAPAADDGSVAATHAHNPYKGLRAFSERDATDFFGRESLVEQLLAALRSGDRLVALVGPSGSGKSSVVAAGLIPRLRRGDITGSERWRIVSVVPERLFDDFDGWQAGDGHVLLVIDQFEDLFVVTDAAAQRRFLRAVSAALRKPDARLTVVLTLRADFYDRPLLDPDFAEIFVPAVMNVLPMTIDEVRAAVVEPARHAGVAVEPQLLAELVADTAAQPGALPLLQFALMELFDRTNDATLTLEDYHELGGLRGILSRRAEELYGELGGAEKEVAKQVFLRLVRPGRGTIDSRRRSPLSELTDLDVDPVALSAVLGAFGDSRLLSFDRDQVTGEATVEVAHEALLREWERLAVWIDLHRVALRRHDAFSAAAEEWQAAGHASDYLLAGSRLDEFEAMIHEGTLQLTGRERAFLEASLERRRAERAQEMARSEMTRKLQRRATSRLVALGVAIVALVVVAGYGMFMAPASRRAPVGYVYNGGGVFTVTQIAEHGFDAAVSDLGLTPKKASVDDGPAANLALRRLSQDGAGLIVVGVADSDVDSVAADFPNTRYVAVSLPARQPNVIQLDFAANEGSFLAGATAAATSKTGTIGFIGGMDGPVIWPFEAGYEAGALAVNPTIRIIPSYLSPIGDYDGYEDPDAAATVATSQYQSGADVIYGAAGDSDLGIFSVATKMSGSSGEQLWAIGVDSDRYKTVGDDPANVDWQDWQAHILTSMVVRFDTGISAMLAEYVRGTLPSGSQTFGLAAGGVDVSYSGGFIDGLRPVIDAWRAKIVTGSISVPCVPAGRESQAEALGISSTGCSDSQR